MNNLCGKCKYYEDADNLNNRLKTGICHRYPPQLLLSDLNKEFISLYLEVDANYDWCGEWR